MTRLIEALKKAEEAKRKEESSGTRDFSLELENPAADQGETHTETEPTPESSPADLDLSLEPTFSETDKKQSDELTLSSEDSHDAVEEPAPSYQIEEDSRSPLDTEATQDEIEAEESARRRLTDQTEPQAEPTTGPAKTRKKYLIIFAVIALLLLGIGFAFFYWQLNNQSSPYANVAPAAQNRGFLDSTTTDSTVSDNQTSTETEADAQPIQTEQTQTTIGPVNEPPENPAQPEVDETISVVNALLSPSEQADSGGTAITQRPTVFTVETPQPVPGSEDALTFARTNIQQGEWEAARSELSAILRAQPNNLRTLEYLAQVNIETGNVAQAQNAYARILQLDPHNSTAQAGLIRVSQTNSLDYEATLQSLQNSYPDKAFIPYMLGNHFARQQRWSEAAASYRQAISMAEASAGIPTQYIYNFAVSLDHLRNLDAALAQYKRAGALAREGDNIDVALINARIERLETRLEP